MKRTLDFLFTATLMLTLTLIIAVMPTERDAAIYEDTVRLHILANSDSEEDQELKYVIRDMLLKKYASRLADANSPEDAKNDVTLLCSEIESDVESWLLELGYSYGCDVTVGSEWYDTREYDDFTLPSGYYTSLRVMLGEADGQNWWCVMYPPLCLDIASEEAPRDDATIGYTDEEYRLITKDGYNVKFKILELISESIAFSSKNS